MIDIGLNLCSSQFDHDRQAVLDRAVIAGVTKAIVTGTDLSSSRQAIQLCRQYDDHAMQLFSTVGIHPHHADEVDSDSCRQLIELASATEVVAMGEMGLDFYRDIQPQRIQERAFEMQLQLAVECEKPVFLHQRHAHARFIAILRQWRNQLTRVVVHCFTDKRQALFDYLDLDCYIGITGWICDERRGLELQTLVASIPSDRLLIETDAPYLLPRTMKERPHGYRNEPAFLPHIARQVADCRHIEPALLEKLTQTNALRFFDI